MKKILLFFVILIFHGCFSYGNAIDSIKTNKQLHKFLLKTLKDDYIIGELFPDPCYDKGDEFRPTRLYKADVDGNGLTDLIVDGVYAFVVLDKGNGNYEVCYIQYLYYEGRYTFKSVLSSPDKSAMLLYYDTQKYWKNHQLNVTGKVDTIVYKDGNLVEYNQNQTNLDIKSIAFSTSGCWGSCAFYNIEIKNGVAFYNAKKFCDTTGNFLGKIDYAKYKEITDLLNYINIPSLNDRYEVTQPDNPTATLEVRYTNGTIKRISDYGMRGTLGLRLAYKFFDEFRKVQNWTSWTQLPPDSDYAILSFNSSFKVTFNWISSDKPLTSITYAESDERWAKTKSHRSFSAGDWSFILNSDSTFVYLSRSEDFKKFSIGTWRQTDDSTIVFNWDGLNTLKTIREKGYKDYFPDNSVPSPLRIDNWEFIYSKNSLHPPNK